MTDDKKNRFVLLSMVLCMSTITLIIYANTLNSPFLFDDRPYILKDPAVRMTEFSWDAIKTAAFESTPKHRYMVNISFALNHYFGDYNPTGYHIVNIFIHTLTGTLLFFFIHTTLNRFRVPPDSGTRRTPLSPMLVAFFASLLWLVFPVNTGAVSYVVQRMTSLAALFYVFSIWLYALGRISHQDSGHFLKTTAYFAGCFIAGCWAVLTKENTATLPFVILLYEWFFFQDLRIDFSKRKMGYAIGAIVLFGGISFLYLGSSPLDRILATYNYNDRDFTLPQRVMTEWRVVLYYISLFLWPSPGRLNLDYDFPLSTGLAIPATTAFSLIALTGITAVAIRLSRRHRLIAFCLFWCLINLVIESSVIGLEIIYEHRMYLPFMTIFLMVVLLIFKSAAKPRIPIATVSIFVLLFSVWTWQRNNTWAHPIGFSLDNVKKSPQKTRPHLNLGNYYAKNGDYDQAIRQYKTALTLSPNDKSTALIYNGLANTLFKSGRVDESLFYYFKTLAIYPDFKTAHTNLQQVKAVIAGLSGPQNTHMKKQVAAAHYQTGMQAKKTGKFDEAMVEFQIVRVLQPDFLPALHNLALCQAMTGRDDDAILSFQELIEFQPENANLYYNLASFYALQDQKEAAVACLKQAIDKGYDNWKKIKTDDDLKNIRELPKVKSMIDTHAATTH